ncbi:head-tail connector protein [Ochrobactrum quorumnocens]|uniref:Phage gp6-like head-tail connector protein n=1 Tax=Ochrobactrum quorumnocens TaxID=271865 RepID=A0A5N1K1Z7_9HYPH|nr:head-tail connector protein [[Ochrobactrum] quorumnocens]KAA9370173.1 phage gp6-like head-tail connector protein [[Ochrobactrum] quorumnocens]
MALIDLAVFKRYLRVFHDDEDDELTLYLVAAETVVTEYLDREVVAAGQTPSLPDGMIINPAVSAAILLVGADLYENREPDMSASGDAVLPRHVRALLSAYRVWRE